MIRLHLLASVMAVLVAGCAGYRMGPTNGVEAGSRTVRVQYFANQTLQPRLSEAIAQALRKRFQEDGTYHLANDTDADVVVTGEIVRFERIPVTFQPGDVRTTRDEEITLTVHVLAQDLRAGTKILDREVRGRIDVRIEADQTSAERQALSQLAEDFANKAVPMIVDGSW